MSERSSVDSAALRREARRKRILENSEKRLRSITGRPVTSPYEIQQESGNCLLHDFQNAHRNYVFEEPSQNTSPKWNDEPDFPLYKPPVTHQMKDDVLKKDMKESEIFGKTWMRSLIQRRFHLIILPVIIQLMYIFKLGHLFYNNLFCPFITVKLMEFMLGYEPFAMDIQGQLALVSALFRGSMARHMLKAIFIFSVIASDFSLYIFMIVASDKLFNVTISPYLAY